MNVRGMREEQRGSQAIKDVVGGRVDLDALGVDVCELGLPVVDEDGAVSVAGGVGRAQDVRRHVWTSADALIKLGADGERGAVDWTAGGGPGYDRVEGYVCRTERQVVHRPWEGYV